MAFSIFSRGLYRVAHQGRAATRRFASDAGHAEHQKTTEFWKKGTLAALPVLGLVGAYNVYVVLAHGHAHGSGIEYDHLRIRRKQYPWQCNDCNLFDRECHRKCKAALREEQN